MLNAGACEEEGGKTNAACGGAASRSVLMSGRVCVHARRPHVAAADAELWLCPSAWCLLGVSLTCWPPCSPFVNVTLCSLPVPARSVADRLVSLLTHFSARSLRRCSQNWDAFPTSGHQRGFAGIASAIITLQAVKDDWEEPGKGSAVQHSVGVYPGNCEITCVFNLETWKSLYIFLSEKVL